MTLIAARLEGSATGQKQSVRRALFRPHPAAVAYVYSCTGADRPKTNVARDNSASVSTAKPTIPMTDRTRTVRGTWSRSTAHRQTYQLAISIIGVSRRTAAFSSSCGATSKTRQHDIEANGV